MNFWQGSCGYTVWGKFNAIRQDDVHKYEFEIHIQGKHCHMATFQTWIASNSPLPSPPLGSPHDNIQTVECKAQTSDSDVGGGDLNWVGAESMQAVAQARQECGEKSMPGKMYLTKRDEGI